MANNNCRRMAVVAAVALYACCQIASSAAAAAAAAPPPPSYKTLYELMVATPELSGALGWFELVGLRGLLQNPNTSITCFLPTTSWKSAAGYASWWETDPPGRYQWAILLQHCLDGQKAVTASRLAPTYASSFPDASIWISKDKGSLYFAGELGDAARIIKADLKGGKSIVHLIEHGEQFPSFAPPDTYDDIFEFLSIFSPFAVQLFQASSLGDYIAGAGRTNDITVFAPSDTALDWLVKQLRTSRDKLLRNAALVNLITRAHVVDGRALLTGAMLSYPGPLTVNTLAGPLNATTDLTIFPKRSGPAKIMVLSNKYGSAIMSDFDVGGNSRADGETPQYAVHFLDKVLLPASIKDLKALM